MPDSIFKLIKANDVEGVREAILANPEVVRATNNKGSSSLVCAFGKKKCGNHSEIIELLVQNGADPYAKDTNGHTPVMAAQLHWTVIFTISVQKELNRLKQGHPEVSETALYALVELVNNRYSIPTCVEKLGVDPEVISKGIQEVFKDVMKRLCKEFINLLSDREEIVRNAASSAIESVILDPEIAHDTEIKETVSKALLHTVLNDTKSVRQTATFSLNWLYLRDTASLVEILIPFLFDQKEQYRIAAAEALGYLGHSGSVKALEIVSQDKHEPLRIASGEALGFIEEFSATELTEERKNRFLDAIRRRLDEDEKGEKITPEKTRSAANNIHSEGPDVKNRMAIKRMEEFGQQGTGCHRNPTQRRLQF